MSRKSTRTWAEEEQGSVGLVPAWLCSGRREIRDAVPSSLVLNRPC
jgi:hypothetical protein